MSTTLKLTSQLRRRVASLARAAGQSPHAFMVSAINQQTELAEKRRAFVESALAARRQFQRDGRYFDWEDVREYFQAKVQGRKAARPRARVAK